MATNKIDRIDREIAKTREKLAEYQNRLRELEAQKTEAENLQIVQLVRAVRMTPQELNALLSGGGIPGVGTPAPDTQEKEEITMKSKQLLRTLAAFCTALVLMGGFLSPAYAGGGEEPADGTNDSNVQVEQPEETPPLTPDGNATLVDDYGGNKQLITVTTKNGNYFYILVDRDDEGENTVHFLNQVDEADLMALMDDGDSEEPPAVCGCTEKCQAGAINRNCPVCAFTMTSCTGKAAEPGEPPAAEPEPEKSPA